VTLNQSRAREWLVAVGVGAALVCLMTWPTAPGLFTYGRLDTADGRFSIWNVGWIGHALTTSDTLLDANIFYPHLGTLAYSELNLVAGLLGLPAFVATGSALGATNTAILVGLLGSFLATWALVRRLTGSPVAGLVSATGFTFLPFVQAHTAHIQLLMTFGMPLVLLAFHSLRDRMSDVPVLARHFLGQLGGAAAPSLTADAIALLESYDWPGNVRELRAVMERSFLLTRGRGEIRAQDLPLSATGASGGPSRSAARERLTLVELERQHIWDVLTATGWHQGEAARVLGISEKTLYRKIREFGFERPRRSRA